MKTILRLLMLIVAISVTGSASANDVDIAKRGVVRVFVVAADAFGRPSIGHGTGFAIDNDTIVTNFHVIEPALKSRKRPIVAIVPSEGTEVYSIRVEALNRSKDLALLTAKGANFPPLTVYAGAVESGEDVVALGYPGNVDYATLGVPNSLAAIRRYLVPRSPTLAEGNFSDARSVNGIDALVHSASIARGNSGGPLVDECGRVLGVNTFQTNSSGGDSSFAFASSSRELMQFLRNEGQDFQSISEECVTAEEFAQREKERVEKEEREAQAIAAAEKEAQEKAERIAERDIIAERENKFFLAIILLFAGGLAAAGGGFVAIQKPERRTIGAAVAGIGILTFVAGVAAFLQRPDLSPAEIEARIADSNTATDADQETDPDAIEQEARTDTNSDDKPRGAIAASAMTGAGDEDLICLIDRSQGRITTSKLDDVPFGWDTTGCVNGSKQYSPTNGGRAWTRLLVPNDTATVSRITFTPSSNKLVIDKYALSLDRMTEARDLRARISTDSCTLNKDSIGLLADRQEDISEVLPDTPSERLVYNCQPAG
ncbi:MAG: serine protease [Pseudomonadota bacterium]